MATIIETRGRTGTPDSRERVPELQMGDRLSREEFERRYRAMPGLKKAELINGMVYMPSPVKMDDHASPTAWLVAIAVNYEAATPGVQSGDNGTVRLDSENAPQPDALLRIRPECGGQSGTMDGYVAGPPEWVGEVSATTVSYDLHDKLHVYRRHGVKEYVVWRVWDREIDWFILREGRFDRLPLDSAGLYKSEVFPGLWLEPAALVRGDLARVFQVLQQGLSTPEHAAFVERLRRAQPS